MHRRRRHWLPGLPKVNALARNLPSSRATPCRAHEPRSLNSCALRWTTKPAAAPSWTSGEHLTWPISTINGARMRVWLLPIKETKLDQKILKTTLSPRVVRQTSRTRQRFSAAEAYFQFVFKRIAELGETHVLGCQRRGVFIERRLLRHPACRSSPSATTC